ncbi:hypothetical protein M8C21_012521 [Ambrosia artemisiifolia]|uniref:Transmembrane protein n=1 Tax=Ambrosia artemisiifolia TaxID=4212 RepID=A0AAD5C038_AMBAR|nr:hypothetical protein M8C21_012521 [Ambrosia artemisiifolia]
MSTTFQTLLPPHSLTRISFKSTPTNITNPHYKTLTTPILIPLKLHSTHPHRLSSIQAFDSDTLLDQQYIVSNHNNLDDFLSVAEFCCLASSAALSIGLVINSTVSTSQKPVLEWLGNRVTVWQPVLLIVGIVIGVVIRRRQWRRVCFGFGKPGSSGVVNLVERIEKVEEDVRNSATIIRVLSRQLEKLGIRFRVTRKSMKEPIAQTAELAKKNSEATRALAMQEDNLEKELGEIQKVLLAMQDQQQKQLELILAIAKSGKLLDNNPVPSQNQTKSQNSNLAAGVSHSDGTR